MKGYWAKLLENGLILAICTAFAYYLTYLRLGGALAAYALPAALVDIDVPDIIATMIDLVYKFWRVLVIPVLGLLVGRLFHSAEVTRLWRISILMVASVVFSLSLLGRFESANWILLSILLYAWVGALAKALLYGRGHPGLRAKWSHYLEKAACAKATDARVASGIGYLALAIAVMYVLSGAVREHAANEQLARQDFFVARDYENQIVVYENSTRYVLMARDGSALLPAYEVVRYDHIGKLDYMHTGVLAVPPIVAASVGQ